MKITAKVNRGAHAGAILTPHEHARNEGMYAVSETKYESDYIYLETLEEVARHIEAGFSVRMSRDGSKVPPSLIVPAKIKVEY